MRKTLLITIIIVAIALPLLLIVLLPKKSPTPTGQIPKPTPTIAPSPTPLPTDLFVASVLPLQNPTEPYLPFQKITLTFSEDIDPAALRYETEPPTKVSIKSGENNKIIYIIPSTKWETGTTTITILQSTRSASGKALYNPFVYKLITDIPPAQEGEGELP